MSAFLDVDHSLTGRFWQGPSLEEDRLAEAMARDAALPLGVARILLRQGVAAEEAPAYLDPKLRDLMPDPRHLRDLGTAAVRIARAVETRERIAIFADYDVDGGASAALLLTWLRGIGQDAALYIPDRSTEGYGPNVPAMAGLAKTHDLILCVDCGTMSHEAIAAAIGADVVVADHHLGGETLPPALAVVNPNRQDETSPLGALCAAGVVFMLLVEVNRLRREAGLPTPDLMAMLDLVALATVADVAPLTGLNRAFVRQGLAVMARRERPGLAALADVAGMTAAPNAGTIGFAFGPRINAGGRIGQADLGARLLATPDPAEAAAIAARLEDLNRERREIEAQVRTEALAQIEARGPAGALAWAAGEGWHPGVVGIVAARVKEATHAPSVVMALEGDEAKGSARSVTGVDIGSAIHRLAQEGLIEKGGGHAAAAGLTLRRDGIGPAMARLAELLARQGAGAEGPRALTLDGMLMAGAASPELIGQLEAAGPFGAGCPAPRFALADQRIADARVVGDGHLKLTVTDGTGSLDAISFGAMQGELGPALIAGRGQRFHLAGRLEINHFRGRSRPQLRLEDAAPAKG